MKKPMFISLILVIFAYNGKTQSVPKIHIENKVCDRGDVPYGSYGKFKFPVKNIDDAPLIIKVVRSSCGCLYAEWPQKPIEPGQWDTIYGIYDTKRLGPINKSLTVSSNDTSQSTIILKIKGEVFQEKVSELAFYVNDERLVLNKRNQAEFNKTENDTLSFRVANTTDNPQSFKIKYYQLNSAYENPVETVKTLDSYEEIRFNVGRLRTSNGKLERMKIHVDYKGKNYSRTVYISESY
ncbi:MAG: DUF1573 domain-containing protein [Flavobacteriales bacterium]